MFQYNKCALILFILSLCVITSSLLCAVDYSINLMWINRALNVDQRYVYPAHDEETLYRKLLSHVFKWAHTNPASTVNLWFDSALTPKHAVENTEQLIAQYRQAHPDIAPVVLRDVRALPYVANYPEVFSEKTPIFFRVDLLRVIAQVHDISTGITPYFVYADLDIDPLSPEVIFDADTMEQLEQFGIVMAYYPIWTGYENSFSIVSRHNLHLLKALQYTLVELNIKRAQNALNNNFYTPEHLADLEDFFAASDEYLDTAITPPASHKCSIHMLSLNDELKEDQTYALPDLHDEESREYFSDAIQEWLCWNPGSTIHLWYDSTTTTKRAIENTQAFMQDTFADHARIRLRDIQTIPYVTQHAALFTAKTPWFREETLWVLTALHEIVTGGSSYCICGDLLFIPEYKHLLDVTTLSTEQLFDIDIMHALQQYGVSIGETSNLGLGFMGGTTTYLFEHAIPGWLKHNAAKAYQTLRGIDCCDECCAADMSRLQQIIYASYKGMFAYLYHRMQLGTLMVSYFDEQTHTVATRPYEQARDGLTPFGLDRFKHMMLNAGADLPSSGNNNLWVPTKRVPQPRPTLIYDDDMPVRNCGGLPQPIPALPEQVAQLAAV